MPLAKSSSNPPIDPRACRVLHACERALDAAAILDAQLAVGMRPQILAREFWASRNAPSLLNAWHAVRDWRHALNEAEAITAFQVVHAHSFPSTMAAVRGSLPSVFDLSHTIEQTAIAQSGPNAGPWMLRSFRVAEQFALSRASAVVTHSLAMRDIACRNGAAPENVFCVPEPLAARALSPDRDWATLHGIDLGYDAVIFALPRTGGIEPILRAFADILVEIDHAVLVFELGEHDRGTLLAMARDLEVADNIRCVSADEEEKALGCADVVVAPVCGEPNQPNACMLRAIAAGKPVVAADTAENRECSPDSRGVIWFRSGDNHHLAQQAAFVARNPDFARALGEAGRVFIAETRDPHVVGERYRDVYKHAISRRREDPPKIAMPQLYTANVQV